MASKPLYQLDCNPALADLREQGIEEGFINQLEDLKCAYRPDIRDRAAHERNLRQKFESLNRVTLTDGEFARLLGEIVTPDVFTASRSLLERNAFTRDDGTPLNYTLVNIKDWCKNNFEADNGNGFVRHTTGSSMTLTSFKASTLPKESDSIHKCVFVVDRKDLDCQTREEFNRFGEGCVEEITNTAACVPVRVLTPRNQVHLRPTFRSNIF